PRSGAWYGLRRRGPPGGRTGRRPSWSAGGLRAVGRTGAGRRAGDEPEPDVPGDDDRDVRRTRGARLEPAAVARGDLAREVARVRPRAVGRVQGPGRGEGREVGRHLRGTAPGDGPAQRGDGQGEDEDDRDEPEA